MAKVLEARDDYRQAERDARLLRARARARLGHAVVVANRNGSSFEKIARDLECATEQVRRYRQAYLDWCNAHPDEPLED